ncbi:hypothetical protein [Microbacterium enclense]|uniref:hypothetical protein n=1 Tax=Microbacterium enclense TaxID=993073 RepID=UPI003D72A010
MARRAGLPATGAVPTDAAIATYLRAQGSQTNTAFREVFGGSLQVVNYGSNPLTPRPAGIRVVLWLRDQDVHPAFVENNDIVLWGGVGAPWAMENVPGMVGLFRARSLELADGANVTSLPNLVPGGTAALPINSIPTFKVDGINGHPSVRFPNQGVLRTTGYSAWDGEHNIFMIVKATDNTTTDFVFDATDSTLAPLKLAIGRNTTNWIIQRGTAITGRSADGRAVLIHARFDGADQGTAGSSNVNRAGPISGTFGAAVAVDRYTLGGRGDNTNKLTGDIADVAIVRGPISELNATRISELLMADNEIDG